MNHFQLGHCASSIYGLEQNIANPCDRDLNALCEHASQFRCCIILAQAGCFCTRAAVLLGACNGICACPED